MHRQESKTSPIKQRILHYAENLGISKRFFYTTIGVSRGTLESKTGITEDVICKFLKAYPEVNIQWLMTGEGEMQLKESPTLPAVNTSDEASISEPELSIMMQHQIATNLPPGTPYYDIDFIGGFDQICNDPSTPATCNIVIPEFNKGTIWCNVSGHSMEPKINHGDIVALRECTLKDVQYGEIYAVVMDTLCTIKIIRRGQTPDTLLFVPLNISNFELQEFPIHRIRRIYKVIGVICKFF